MDRAWFSLIILSGCLAGCASSVPSSLPQTASRSDAALRGKILVVRQVSGGQALGAVMQALGQGDVASSSSANEIIIQLPDGSVKTLIPSPSSPPQRFFVGEEVFIQDSPELQLAAH